MKQKGQHFNPREEKEKLAYYAGVPQRIEEPITNRLDVGWNPTARALYSKIAPLVAINYQWGTSRGRSQETRLLRPIVILAQARYERQGQNDVPLLQECCKEAWEDKTRTSEVPLPVL